MINRDNYMDVVDFLIFQSELKQNDPKTVAGYWCRLVHLMKWADDNLLPRTATVRPVFPAYLEKFKTVRGERLGANGFTAICKTARAFYLWAKAEHPGRYRGIDQNFIISIRPPRMRSEQAQIHTRELYTLDEVISLATCQTHNLCQQRTQAAAAFLFLSGMRITAFSSLPISCVDLEHMRIYQLPEKGVLTKNRKATITTLLDIPELLAVVRKWDELVRGNLNEDMCWYAHLNRMGDQFLEEFNRDALENRKHGFTDDLRELCALAGVAYKSAHKMRSGHAVYGLKHSDSMDEFKAVSQNLGHANMGITDGIYGRLVEDDQHNTILGLSKKRLKGGR